MSFLLPLSLYFSFLLHLFFSLTLPIVLIFLCSHISIDAPPVGAGRIHRASTDHRVSLTAQLQWFPGRLRSPTISPTNTYGRCTSSKLPIDLQSTSNLKSPNPSILNLQKKLTRKSLTPISIFRRSRSYLHCLALITCWS